MAQPILQIENLNIAYTGSEFNAVQNAALTLYAGESVGLIGESGSGKSSLALGVMGLLGRRARVDGSIVFDGAVLSNLPEAMWDRYRWNRIAIVFQNSLDVFNPVLTVGEQLAECARRHLGEDKAAATVRAERFFALVGLDPIWTRAYPHQLSGGMRQKALIAMALCCEPELLLVDKPTMALDAVSKNEIVRLLRRLQSEQGFSMLVISHELPVIASLTGRVLVMYAGNLIEEGPTERLLKDPLHPYTRGLIYASPAVNPYRDMWGIPGALNFTGGAQCPFFGRCNQCIAACADGNPTLKAVSDGRKVACVRGGIVTLLHGRGLTKHYPGADGGTVEACSGCNVRVRSGEICALIGESGSGKTTVAELLAGIQTPDVGEIVFDGERVEGNSATAKIGGIQMVFQDPLSATNEHFTIADIVKEPLDILREGSLEERLAQVKEVLLNVRLPCDDAFLARRGFMLSGGQRQRIAVARALTMRPRLLIADEISAMLDPSTAANLLRLLKGLQNAQGFAMLYITHNLALAQKIADKVYVMQCGRIVEKGPVEDVLQHPSAAYTRRLLGDDREMLGRLHPAGRLAPA